VRVTERLRHAVYSAYYAARSLNYPSSDGHDGDSYGCGYGYPIKKTVGGISFRSYELYNLHGNDPLLRRLLRRLDAGDVFYDVGANVGVYSCAAAACGATVHAFEPNPKACEKARANFKANGFGCAAHSYALSDTDGRSTFHVSSYPEVSSLHREKATVSGGRVVRSTESETRRLDTVVGEPLPSPDHLKVDVEGAGVDVLRGAERTLAEAEPTVYFEPHGNAASARRILKAKGYRIKEIGNEDKSGFTAEPNSV